MYLFGTVQTNIGYKKWIVEWDDGMNYNCKGDYDNCEPVSSTNLTIDTFDGSGMMSLEAMKNYQDRKSVV